MFLDLPVELRLRIAEYALEQHPAAGIPHTDRHLQEYEHTYRPSENLALLLVCRQFRQDFLKLAYGKTRFTLWGQHRMQGLPLHILKSIRRIACSLPWPEMVSWGSYCYNMEQLRLDELIFFCSHGWAVKPSTIQAVVLFLRRLLHIKTVKLVLYDDTGNLYRNGYFSLIGAIMKEDHFQRYDAPGAPNLEATWWEWHYNALDNVVTLQAQDPRPFLPEEDYMLLMKPKVDALMADAERLTGIYQMSSNEGV